eukprot:TRINITY_DN11216_c0_g3_i1.p1 TRINITY_DN11216_c0_g3~~TRINITY_DN11216_c0_g3_i1.p1  ORF type:complete len:160 (+),score=49.30 TRINITY_DN11216_c0_g3_i1:52-480(+)
MGHNVGDNSDVDLIEILDSSKDFVRESFKPSQRSSRGSRDLLGEESLLSSRGLKSDDEEEEAFEWDENSREHGKKNFEKDGSETIRSSLDDKNSGRITSRSHTDKESGSWSDGDIESVLDFTKSASQTTKKKKKKKKKSTLR